MFWTDTSRGSATGPNPGALPEPRTEEVVEESQTGLAGSGAADTAQADTAQADTAQADTAQADTGQVDEVAADEEFLAAMAAEFDAIQAALTRLDDGSFDSCQVCGARIGQDRLLADPLLTRCPVHT